MLSSGRQRQASTSTRQRASQPLRLHSTRSFAIKCSTAQSASRSSSATTSSRTISSAARERAASGFAPTTGSRDRSASRGISSRDIPPPSRSWSPTPASPRQAISNYKQERSNTIIFFKTPDFGRSLLCLLARFGDSIHCNVNDHASVTSDVPLSRREYRSLLRPIQQTQYLHHINMPPERTPQFQMVLENPLSLRGY